MAPVKPAGLVIVNFIVVVSTWKKIISLLIDTRSSAPSINRRYDSVRDELNIFPLKSLSVYDILSSWFLIRNRKLIFLTFIFIKFFLIRSFCNSIYTPDGKDLTLK